MICLMNMFYYSNFRGKKTESPKNFSKFATFPAIKL